MSPWVRALAMQQEDLSVGEPPGPTEELDLSVQ